MVGKVSLEQVSLSQDAVALEDRAIRDVILATWGSQRGTLLGHAFDGVIWGRVSGDQLRTAHDHSPELGAQLRGETLLDLRLFDQNRELRIWRRQHQLLACLVREVAGGPTFAAWQDRSYRLIAKPNEKPPEAPFVLLEGLAGQRHAPPVPQGLRVRHYYERDEETGLLRTAEHRLLGLEAWQ